MFDRCVVEGDLNAAYICDVWSKIEHLAQAESDVVLDLSEVDFIDSHGAGAVVCLVRRLKQKGLRLKVLGLHGQPLRLFHSLHLVPVLAVARGEVK